MVTADDGVSTAARDRNSFYDHLFGRTTVLPRSELRDGFHVHRNGCPGRFVTEDVDEGNLPAFELIVVTPHAYRLLRQRNHRKVGCGGTNVFAARTVGFGVRRRTFLAGSAGVGVAGLAGCIGPSSDGFGREPTETYQNPVFERIFPDPSAVRSEDGTFYAYGTEEDGQDGERFRRVPILESKDLVNWEYAGEAFETKPDWRDGAYLWAPDVVRTNGTYYLYYSYSEWGDENPGIGVATSDDPAGPFTDRGKLFRSDEIGVENSIDPMVVREDGTPYLFWGSKQGIYAIQLRPNGFRTVGEKTHVAGDHYEGAYVVERDGTYYFFGSVGICCDGVSSTYHVRAGRSDSLLGPYEGDDGNDLRGVKGPVVVEGGNGFVGPGHNAVVTDDVGDDWLLYHAYEEGEGYVRGTPRRTLMLDRIDWNDGWPTVEGKTPSREARAPKID